MKRILFDLLSAQPAGGSKFHGGGEYIKIVFNNLVEKYSLDYEIIVFFDNDKFLDTWILELIETKGIKWYSIKSLSNIVDILKKEEIDIVYSGLPYKYKKEWIPDGVCFKGTIHGLRLLELPTEKNAYLYLKGTQRVKEIIKYVLQKYVKSVKYKEFNNTIEILNEIFIVSNHSLYAVKYYYPQYISKRMRVFYTPAKKFEYSKLESSPYDFPYLLIIGGNRWEKNSYRMIQAVERLFLQGYIPDYKVVIIGDLSKSVKRAIKNPDRFILRNYVDSEELENLYKFCTVFLYCSLNEGFGMPPLEAMKYGRTCVVSGVCSLPEICGDATMIVNPYDIDEMSGRILNAIEKPIEEDIILRRFNAIYNKQKEDLELLCQAIVD